jgi:L-iditol 2-dehydrogenase
MRVFFTIVLHLGLHRAVVALGPGVKKVQHGDRKAVEPGLILIRVFTISWLTLDHESRMFQYGYSEGVLDYICLLCAGLHREVVALGPGVKKLQPGNRVAIEPGVPCWSHHASREGRYNLDPDIRFFATPPHDGSLCQVSMPSEMCIM